MTYSHYQTSDVDHWLKYSFIIKEANDKTLSKTSNKTRLKAARSGSKNTRAQQPALEKSESSLDAYA